mmetsp:Transcript_4561/g.15173  ORF Transcript_4561/g.15173 Transcript_4561/m.15173 type:complete len:755 (-) Transcript_4561:104-2368(-)
MRPSPWLTLAALTSCAALSLSPSCALPRRPAVSRSPPPGMINKKQAELAAMLERARAAREGGLSEATAPPPPPKRPKPPPAAKKTAVTRDDIFAAFKRSNQPSTKPARPSAPKARPRPAAPSGPSLEEEYAAFDAMVAGSRTGRQGRALSSELLTSGEPLPTPAKLSALAGHPTSFDSLAALAAGRSYLVLLASSEPIMSNALRSDLVAFASRFPGARLDAAVAAVSRVAPATYRKLERKGGVSFPLLSDPDSAWLSQLNVDRNGGPCGYLLDVARGGVLLASFGPADPAPLLDRVTAAVEARAKGSASPTDAAAPAPPAPSTAAEAEAARSERRAAELFGALPTAAPPPPSAGPADAGADLEALRRENEELKALQALQRENEQLKAALEASRADEAAAAQREEAAAAAQQREAAAAAQKAKEEEEAEKERQTRFQRARQMSFERNTAKKRREQAEKAKAAEAAAKATADATKDLDAEKLAKFQQEVADGGGVDNKEMMNVAVVSDIGWKGGAEPAQGDDVWAQYDFKCAVSDVLEYAEYLGMDIKQDAHLLWIADEALQAPEPQGWEQRLDPKGGVYYYHGVTGMVLNQHPLDHHYQQFYHSMKAQYEAQATVGPKLSNVLSPTAHLDTMKRGQMPALREVKFIKDSVESKMGFIFHRTDDAFDKSFFNVEGSVQPIIKTVKPGGLAESSGLVPGDVVLSVNGISGLNNFQVVEMLRQGKGVFNLVVFSGQPIVSLGQPVRQPITAEFLGLDP